MSVDRDLEVRTQAFLYLDQLRLEHGDALPREALVRGFEFLGTRVPLMGPQGIFKPAVLEQIPLSITTAPPVEGKPRPYEDSVGSDGLIHYKYRGTDPKHHENVGLRTAMERGAPLVYFFGLVPGLYAAAWPTYIVADSPSRLTFTIAADDRLITKPAEPLVADALETGRRAYVTTLVRQRLHQQGFRTRVLEAYKNHCSVCRLRHRALLEASHILPDGHPRGEPWVSNGLALCKIHHAAFDRHFMGIRPDLVIEIREDILKEEDGPMLRHGLQELHHKSLLVIPQSRRLRPNPDFLAERFQLFMASA